MRACLFLAHRTIVFLFCVEIVVLFFLSLSCRRAGVRVVCVCVVSIRVYGIVRVRFARERV